MELSRAGASRKGSLGAIVREMRNIGPSTVWRRQILPCILAAIVGLGVSVAAGRMTAVRDNQNAGLQFEVIAENHFMVLQNGINEYVSRLRTVRALFDSAATPVTRNTFESFTRPLLQENSAIATLSWLPRVKNSGRAEHERLGVVQGLSDYHIKDMGADGNMTVASERSEYYPVFYATVPLTSPLFGLDLRSELETLAEIEHARDTDRLGFSQIPALVSSGRTRSGVLFSLPIYKPGLPHTSIEDRRRNLMGFVHGSVVTAEMIDTIIANNKSLRGLTCFSLRPPATRRLCRSTYIRRGCARPRLHRCHMPLRLPATFGAAI